MIAKVDIPILETARLVLRDHRLADFDTYAAMWRDPVVTRFIGGKPRTREESWVRFLRHVGMWHHLGFGFWAVEEKASGGFIGEGGFHELRRDMTPSLEGTLEAGWAFVPEAHGKGLATELVAAILAWAADNHPAKPVTAMIDPAHAVSIRVAEKSGFVERTRTIYGGEPVVLFDHRR
jgi:RimJ/RimL family protein N-acetyltransferase